MGWFNKIEDGSRTIVLMAQSSASMRRRFALGGVALVVILGVGGIFLFRHLSAQSQEQVANAWASLDHCLVGEPLKDGEKPSTRFRASQLAAMSLRMEAGKEKEAWPARCAAHAVVLHEGLSSSDDPEGEKNLAYWSKKLADALTETGSVGADLSEVIDQTWAQAVEEGMDGKDGKAAGPKPPQPATTLAIDDLQSTIPLVKNPPGLDDAQSDVHPGTGLHLLVEDTKRGESVVCTVAADAEVVQCALIPASIPASDLGLRLLGTADAGADPLVFSGSRGSEGVFRSGTGAKVAATTTLGGWAGPDNFSAVLGWDDSTKRMSLIRKSGGNDPLARPIRLESKLQIAEPVRDVQVLWDHIVFRGANRYDETWLASAKINTGAVPYEPPSDIGMLPEAGTERPPEETDVPIAGCRTRKAQVARVRGDSHDFLSFHVAGRWTKPVQTSKIGGDLSCRRVEAWLTQFHAPPGAGMLESSIVAERCTPTRCTSNELTVGDMLEGSLSLAPVAAPMVAHLGGKILVVWMAGDRGGLRMRFAPLDGLAQAPDQILFDDLVQGGEVLKTSTIAETKLLVRESFALLLLRTSEGLHALHIDPEGKVDLANVRN